MPTPETDRLDEDPIFSRTLTDEELSDLTEEIPLPGSITFSTQDFDVAGLVNRLERSAILIPSFGEQDERITTAGFQRGFVWTKRQMDRFIESLLLGYPVPGIFLVRQTQDSRHLVLDGQQRLETLRRFYKGVHAGKTFSLDNTGPAFQGKTYETLDENARFRLDDSVLRATIVASDSSAEVNEAVYQIFERLNSGGTQLTPHEVRVALYAGDLIAFLEELNQNADWRHLYGKPSARIRDQELILRILALYLSADSYSRPLKTFLNGFVANNRSGSPSVRGAGDLFRLACAELRNTVGPRALRRTANGQVNGAQTEAVVVAVMRGMLHHDLTHDLGAALDELLNDEGFVLATTRATADNDAVEQRLMLSNKAFSG